MAERSASDTSKDRSRWPACDIDALFEHDATLALDVHGQVRFCSAAVRALIGRKGTEVLGQHIGTLIPSLPLRRDTPGYNTAYVAFWFGRDRWHAYEVLDASRRAIAVQLAIEPIQMSSEPCFVMSLRKAASDPSADRSMRIANALLDDCAGQIGTAP